MTEAMKKRNRIIKQQVMALLRNDYTMKEATYMVADKWFLSKKHIEKIYYETRIE